MNIQINRHLSDFNCDFTIEFEVKGLSANISDIDYEFESETGSFINMYAKQCFEEISKLKYAWIIDHSFAGRSNGWFVLLCNDKNINKVTPKQFGKIETIIEKYINNYQENIEAFYSENIN
jgi:hypothetical protein